MRPVDVNEANVGTVWQNLYGSESTKSTKYKFNIGDQVRISKTRRTFKKGYLPNWTEEGTFCEQELERVYKLETDRYRVEKVLRTRMRNKRKEYFVKWLGYPEKFNSLVPAEHVKGV